MEDMEQKAFFCPTVNLELNGEYFKQSDVVTFAEQ